MSTWNSLPPSRDCLLRVSYVDLHIDLFLISQDAVVEEKLRQLAFREADMDALAVNYSGGMKRRLAVSIAFIGEVHSLTLSPV